MKFETKEKSGVNTYGHYQFGSNCCIGCKADRPLNAQGMWCDGCKNYQNVHPEFKSSSGMRKGNYFNKD